jgi:hypothetical protein
LSPLADGCVDLSVSISGYIDSGSSIAANMSITERISFSCLHVLSSQNLTGRRLAKRDFYHLVALRAQLEKRPGLVVEARQTAIRD